MLTVSGLFACASLLSVAGHVPADTGYASMPIHIESGAVRIHGTLTLPAGEGPFAVVLLVAGSGPTDRDGNSALLGGKNNSLRLLAEGLARHGIASVRYDKRGIGESAVVSGNEADLRFTMYAEDAAAWLKLLQGDARFDRVIAAGHSEGALLVTLAAHSVGADAVILVAGAGRPVGDVLREQLRSALPAELVGVADSILTQLEQGRPVAEVPAALQVVFRPSVQPYMMSWLPLDPAAELAKLDVPVLVVSGSTDVQVTADDAARLATASRRARHVQIAGMNHVLKLVGGTAQEQMPSYSDPDLPVAPLLVSTVVEFVTEVARG